METKPDNSNQEKRPAKFISEELDQARLDKTVKQHFDLPWKKARTWISTGKVFLDGNCVTDEAYKVTKGIRIELRMSARKALPESELDQKELIYFDQDIVIVNKPAGMMTVPHPESDETSTLDRLVLDNLRVRKDNPQLNRASLGVVHRIDKETSGLLVFTRNFSALKAVSQQFREHTVERKYYAIVQGKAKAQTIRTRIARDAGDGIRGSVPEGAKNYAGEELGRTAVTHVEVVQELEGATLVACRLETGRTHQIRIHLSEAGHPILGEKVYIRNFTETQIPAYRVMLHAAELGFIHPKTGEKVQWVQELPTDFQNRLKSLVPKRKPNKKA